MAGPRSGRGKPWWRQTISLAKPLPHAPYSGEDQRNTVLTPEARTAMAQPPPKKRQRPSRHNPDKRQFYIPPELIEWLDAEAARYHEWHQLLVVPTRSDILRLMLYHLKAIRDLGWELPWDRKGVTEGGDRLPWESVQVGRAVSPIAAPATRHVKVMPPWVPPSRRIGERRGETGEETGQGTGPTGERSEAREPCPPARPC
jgi:hypothetical protein